MSRGDQQTHTTSMASAVWLTQTPNNTPGDFALTSRFWTQSAYFRVFYNHIGSDERNLTFIQSSPKLPHANHYCYLLAWHTRSKCGIASILTRHCISVLSASSLKHAMQCSKKPAKETHTKIISLYISPRHFVWKYVAIHIIAHLFRPAMSSTKCGFNHLLFCSLDHGELLGFTFHDGIWWGPVPLCHHEMQ